MICKYSDIFFYFLSSELKFRIIVLVSVEYYSKAGFSRLIPFHSYRPWWQLYWGKQLFFCNILRKFWNVYMSCFKNTLENIWTTIPYIMLLICCCIILLLMYLRLCVYNCFWNIYMYLTYIKYKSLQYLNVMWPYCFHIRFSFNIPMQYLVSISYMYICLLSHGVDLYVCLAEFNILFALYWHGISRKLIIKMNFPNSSF